MALSIMCEANKLIRKVNDMDMKNHRCDRNERWVMKDTLGIFLDFVCDKCENAKKSKYHPSCFGEGDETQYERAMAFGEQIEED